MTHGLNEATLQKIFEVFHSFSEIKTVVLYGSRAKGTHRPGSDIDLCIRQSMIPETLLNRIRSALEAMNTPYTFDLSVFESIENPDLKDHIERVGKAFYARAQN